MRKSLLFLWAMLFAIAPVFNEVANASDESKDDDRLRNCGTILTEILDVPDIPHDLLDRADCAVVFPSVLKAAFRGGDAFVAAGPAGRDISADTDATLRSEILSYSRARGLFAGASLEGSTIRPGNGDNERLCGRKIPAGEIVLSGTVAVPPPVEQLVLTLDTRTLKHRP